MPRQIFEARFDATPQEVRRTLRAAAGAWAAWGVAPAAAEAAELALAEALNNVVIHAYRRASGPVHVRVRPFHGGLLCVIHDLGRPLPASLLSRSRSPEIGDLPEGGFGWPLIHRLSSRVRHRRRGGANVLALAIPAPSA